MGDSKAWVALAFGFVAACGGSERGDGTTATDGVSTLGEDGIDTTAADELGDEGETSPKLDLTTGGGQEGAEDEGGDEECGPEHLPTPNATLTGTVYAPNLEIPISGALVYLVDEDPEPVPDGVYCAECVELPCEKHYVLTEPDGSFELPAVAGPGQKFVVQKGQFLHVTEMDVAQGDVQVPAVDSSLPGEWNPAAGHWIPRIAVFETFNDSIYDLLAKIGLGQIDSYGALVDGTEQFDVLDPYSEGQLLDNLDAMMGYHIIFVPCMSQGGLGQPANRLDNIRSWTEAGGKWYVTDWANEYLYEPFPDYQDFHDPDYPDLGSYESHGTITDPDLLAWLSALPPGLKDIGGGSPTLNNLPSVTLEDNWSGLDMIHDIFVQNEEGEDVNVGHHEWVSGPCGACTDSNTERPMTVSGQWGCGRMMFSTYHTTEFEHQGLTPQELVLLYIILEIGVCHGEAPPPPPPIE